MNQIENERLSEIIMIAIGKYVFPVKYKCS